MIRLKPTIRKLALMCVAAAIALAVFATGPVTSGSTASAHGKELSLFVSTLIPDESELLRRIFRVEVLYANDFNSVENAKVVLSGSRKEGGEDLDEITLTEMSGESGVYIGEVVFNRFGEWNIDIDVTSAFSQGNGSTHFVEEVRPVILSDAEEQNLVNEAARVRQLQLFFSFGWWPDIVSILLRVAHSVSALAYFGAVSMVLLSVWLGRGDRRVLNGPVGKYFLPASLAGLAGILLSGLYGAAFDAPNGAPGIYDIKDLLQLPYANAYLAAFLVKPLMWAALVILAFRINSVVVRPARNRAPAGAAPVSPAAIGSTTGAIEDFSPSKAVRKLTYIGATVGILIVADLAILIYIHYISHLGVFLPPGS